MKANKTTFGVIAVLCIILGFGMNHGGENADILWLAHTGSVLLGIGSLYLILILIQSLRQNHNNEN